MKRKVFIIIVLVILFFCWHSILHPFEITSQGYITTSQSDDHLVQGTRTYVYKLQRLNFLPVSMINVELNGYSGLDLGTINYDGTNIKCNAKIINNEPTDPNNVIIYYKILGLHFKQIIRSST